MEKLVRVLKVVVLALVVLVLGLTIVAVLRKKNSSEITENLNLPSNDAPIPIDSSTILFGDIGVLRTQTKDGRALVVEPFFEYNAVDLPFQEELVKKKVDIRYRIAAFFSVRTYQELQELDEADIKRMILELVNEILTLNTIEKVYFEQYIILD